MARGQSRAQSEATPSPAKLAAEAKDAANEAAFKKLPTGTQFWFSEYAEAEPKSADELFTTLSDFFGSESPEDNISTMDDDFIEANPDFVKKLREGQEGAYEGGKDARPSAYQSPTATQERFDYSFGDGESSTMKSVLTFPDSDAPKVEVEFSVKMKVSYEYDDQDSERTSESYRVNIKSIIILLWPEAAPGL